MSLNCVATVKQNINKLLKAGFIQPIEEATWLSSIVVVPKKNVKLRICVDFRKLNKVIQKYRYPLPFSDEVLNITTWYETYSFLNGYSKYHQIFIALEDTYKITFVIDWGVFVLMVMPFGVKNGPPTF